LPILSQKFFIACRFEGGSKAASILTQGVTRDSVYFFLNVFFVLYAWILKILEHPVVLDKIKIRQIWKKDL